MKVYIAGPIAGRHNYRDIFQMAQRKLEARNYIVLNPAVQPEGMSKADYMRICMAMIDSADIVALLDGWELSQGARLEAEYCRFIGKAYRPLIDVLNVVQR